MSGRIVILNGAPRSGKSTIVRAIQDKLDGRWINLGVDHAMATLPPSLRPGIGLRPGGERPDLEAHIPNLFFAAYDSIAAHARHGFDVVADFGHHDSYSRPLGILPACARRLEGLQTLFVGVRCPIDIIMARRNADPQDGYYASGPGIPEPVQRWQDAVHVPGIYDLELDTSLLDADECVLQIANALDHPRRLPALGQIAAL
jgi:chloramphenicol 3-O phosphotransferase